MTQMLQPPPSRPPFGFRFVQRLLRLLLGILTRMDVSGLEHLPDHGPAILAPNHVVWFDVVPIFAYTRTPVVTLAAEKWEHHWALGPLMRHFASAIFVQRGEFDRKALEACIAVLRRGEVLGVAPEGTRSYSGVLGSGHDGLAWLAGRTGASIVPLVIWGHEDVGGDWKRLRRPKIIVRIGEPFNLPPEAAKARSRELPAYTLQIMHRLAELLPEGRRGVYGGVGGVTMGTSLAGAGFEDQTPAGTTGGVDG